jgi:hypothetical protein
MGWFWEWRSWIVAVVVAIAIYKTGVLIIVRRSGRTHVAGGVTTGEKGTWKTGRYGGLYWASWPFSSVSLNDGVLAVEAPKLSDVGLPAPETDMTSTQEITVRRLVFFTYLNVWTTPTRYESRSKRQTFWLPNKPAQQLLDVLHARPLEHVH